jgi:hypothetical protein
MMILYDMHSSSQSTSSIMPPLATLSTKPHYGAIPRGLPEVHLHVAPPGSSSSNDSISKPGRALGIILVVLSGLLIVQQLLSWQPSSSIQSESEYPVRHCTFNECARARCDVQKRPYVCVDPRTPYFYRMAPGGCKSTPWTSVYCADSCTLSHCADALPASNGFSCALGTCPLERCAVERQPYSTCDPIRAPYQVRRQKKIISCCCAFKNVVWALLLRSACLGLQTVLVHPIHSSGLFQQIQRVQHAAT